MPKINKSCTSQVESALLMMDGDSLRLPRNDSLLRPRFVDGPRTGFLSADVMFYAPMYPPIPAGVVAKG